MTHRVELSPAAVRALRALPRTEQKEVAAALDRLASEGLARGSTPGGPVEVAAGGAVVVCASREGKVVVLTVRVGARAGLVALAGQRARQWWTGMTGGGAMSGFVQDVRYATRSLRKSPGFTAAVVLTLALGIGATASIFSVAEGVLMTPFPYRDVDRLVGVWGRWTGFEKTWVSEPEYVYYLQENTSFEDIALYFSSSHNFTSADNPERVGSSVVTPNTFEVLGVTPLLGRAFTWDESRAEASVVMLGHDAWQRRFNGDRGIIGRDVEINARPYTVVGILPKGFIMPIDYGNPSPTEIYFTGTVDVTTPAALPTNGGSHGYYALGRLADGVDVDAARRDLEGLIDRARSEGVYQESFDYTPVVQPVTQDVLGSARTTILILLGACTLVLLIACGNAANLILSRAEGRMQDVAVRQALGAGRGRIVRQLFAESALLALGGGAAGLALAAWGIDALLAISPGSVPRADAVGLDPLVVAATLAVTAATAILFGWVPAARVARSGVGGALSRITRGAGSDAGSNRAQGLLVAGQMAMAVVLLASAGLMMRTFTGLLAVDLGFRAENVLTMRLTTPAQTYPEAEDVQRFWAELLRRVRDLPGVRNAGAARLLPLASQMGDSGFHVVGYTPAPGETTAAEWQWVTPGYLEVMGIPLVRGRTFEESDRADGRTVMIVNEAAAQRFWPDSDPLGARVATFAADTAVVVGIVGNLRHDGPRSSAKPRYYRPQGQIEGWGTISRMTLTIQAQGDPRTLIDPVRRIVRDLDPAMPLSEVRTMDEVVAASVAPARFALVLLGVFGALALALAVIGVYGVLAYAVSRRTREIGIRLALGADSPDVVGMVVRQGMTMAIVGVVAGMALAWALTGFMRSMLFGVEARDPLTFVAVPAVFLVVALIACWVPAHRAARVEPTNALRYD